MSILAAPSHPDALSRHVTARMQASCVELYLTAQQSGRRYAEELRVLRVMLRQAAASLTDWARVGHHAAKMNAAYFETAASNAREKPSLLRPARVVFQCSVKQGKPCNAAKTCPFMICCRDWSKGEVALDLGSRGGRVAA